MSLELLLQISMATMVCVSAILVNTAYQMVALPVMTAVAAFSSVYLTDIKRSFVIPEWVVNFGGAVIAVYIISEIRALDSQNLLFASACLLLCLQISLFYQAKTQRVYWQLAMTSLLCVVVSAAVVEQAAFALWVLIYLFVGLFSLCVFFLFREVTRYGVQADVFAHPQDPGGGEVTAAIPATLARQNRVERPAPDLAQHAGRKPEPAGGKGQPMASPKPPVRASRLEGGVFGQVAPRTLGRELVWQVLRLCVGTLVITVLLFLFTPRRSENENFGTVVPTFNTVGNTSTVKLGEPGTSEENPEVVMQLRLENGRLPDQSVQLLNPPYIRGSVLNHYDPARREWITSERSLSPTPELLPELSLDEGAYSQEIVLEPQREEVKDLAYAVFPAGLAEARDETGIRFDLANQVLMRPARSRMSSIQYRLATHGIWRDRQLDVVPIEPGMNSGAEMLRVPSRGFDNVKRLAKEIVQQAGVDATDPVAVARALEAHLKLSGEYVHSLTSPPQVAGVDPIESFVTESKAGNCEYFASALALMLRSMNIRSRVVLGFKADEWNDVGAFYQVRQSHAHAWVEAYLLPIDVPPWPEGHPLAAQGQNTAAWLRLDPTPGGDDSEGQLRKASLWQRVRQWGDFLRRTWSQYVIGLTAEQQGTLFAEQWNALQLWFRDFFRIAAWRAWYRNVNLGQFIREWFNWKGGLLAMALSLAGFGLMRGLYLLARRYRTLWSEHARQLRRRQISVEFYRRFETLAAGLALTRNPAQTAQEFAGLVAGQLRALRRDDVAEIPQEIAHAFQRVRYGHQPLDKSQVEAVETALSSLAQVIYTVNPAAAQQARGRSAPGLAG